ncbi:Nitrate/nitrite transporter NarK (NarK) (PDB:4JR9) [Commensalibacter communis]|uniref:MFS transporter n=1 Tax=Commensalibacter communis TaxID=2972786 RepID=UPI0022FF683D|nr:MFS transporter [Commensalibacter communis]CAI3934547.1 Nitrate/nitrite transporter NarK (NarK) (PDB:4JR9) [Commensalibacter communis]CAI3945683.1 Nitrate/nitrite transporter NarK (NarK) (PDB:4JR9) [Commensalibacter communis]CAI3946554.1 Nitrate/nitrite transporter NarK (NarK) (PDB:4JR9) [Commensalibacter communis]CAI3946770.1 Nitrate/nitrite transporter NarK (NarK) (PDB:4JR9) [Commensalibacter communis]
MWSNFVEKVFISPKLMLGYIGVMIFMAGEGLEQGWLSPYLIEHGLSVEKSALLFSVYGLSASVSAFFSGVLTEIYGVRRVMSTGLIMFCIGTFFFLTFGISSHNFWIMLPSYALRGLSYPLFAYGFLVYITYEAPVNRLSTAGGIFWSCYACGLSVLGVMYSSFALKFVAPIHVLWSALFFVCLGGVIALWVDKEAIQSTKKIETEEKSSLLYLLKGITIIYEVPKLGLCGFVRIVNTLACYGFPVFLPLVMQNLGFTISQWLQMLAFLWISNMIANYFFGLLGDKWGWRNTVMWGGCVGCAITTLLFYYVPTWGGGYILTMAAAGAYGACLAAYTPINAIMPMLAPENKGAAMSVLTLAAGLSTFFGPAIVGLFIKSVGAVGVIWVYAALYIAAAFVMSFVHISKSYAQLNLNKTAKI